MKLIGIIQNKNSNSIKLNNFWIKFFKPELLQGINAGDEVEVIYKDNEKEGKVYHNGTSINLTSKEQVKEIKEPKLKDIPEKTINTLIMAMKDIYLYPANTDDIETIAVKLVKGYKKIITEI